MPFRFPVSPNLREFLYQALYNLQGDSDFKLKGHYRQLGRTNSKARMFCNKASLEQINHILGLLGIQWATVYWDDKNKPRVIRNLFEGYKEKGTATDLRRLIDEKIYVTTEKQFFHYLGVTAEAIDGDEYRRNVELSRAGYHLRQWTRKLNSERVQNDLEDYDSLKYLSKAVLGVLFTEKQYDIHGTDAQILFYLFPQTNNYVKKEVIEKKFMGIFKPNKISYSLRRLVELGYVQKHIDFTTEKSYKITGLGESETIKLLNGVLKNITLF